MILYAITSVVVACISITMELYVPQQMTLEISPEVCLAVEESSVPFRMEMPMEPIGSMYIETTLECWDV
jgi:hypothetical protein